MNLTHDTSFYDPGSSAAYSVESYLLHSTGSLLFMGDIGYSDEW